MHGLTDLRQLLVQLEPKLDPSYYGFCSSQVLEPSFAAEAFAIIREHEGWTLVLPQNAMPDRHEPDLRHQWQLADGWFQRITLTVHSSLHAVGLTAAVASVLATHGISCNMIAGFYHDHLFVPQADAEPALRLLRQLASDMQATG